MSKKLLAVDGNSLINRAFYGVKPLTTRDGRNTNAVFGFINMLKSHLDSVNPDYAVISVGSRNDYGHPHGKTLDLLELLEINLYRTDYHGNIVIFSDKTNLTVVTENKEVTFDVYS